MDGIQNNKEIMRNLKSFDTGTFAVGCPKDEFSQSTDKEKIVMFTQKPYKIERSIIDLDGKHAQNTANFMHGILPSPIKFALLEMDGFHGYLLPEKMGDEKVGGAAYIAAAVESVRKEKPVFLLSGGDVMSGQPIADLCDEKPVVEFMNIAGFDAWTIGNHDFDRGPKLLLERIKESKFPVISSNMVDSETGVHISQTLNPLNVIKPYAVINKDNIKTAVIGITKPKTPALQKEEYIKGLSFLQANDAIDMHLPQILNEQPDLLVIHYQNIYESYSVIDKINEIMKDVKPVKRPFIVFVGSHGKRDFPEQVTGENYLIFQGTDRGKELGYIDIISKIGGPVSTACAKYLKISANQIQPSCAINTMLEPYFKKVERCYYEKIGTTIRKLSKSKLEDSPLGILLTEAMKDAAGTETAFIASGSIKDEVDAGDITEADLRKVLPFNGQLIKMELKGSDIKELLEQSAKRQADNKVLQVAGLRMVYNQEACDGKKVIEASINGEPIDDNRYYTVATDDFLLQGGNLYSQFTRGKNVKKLGDFRDVILKYIKKMKTIDIQADGRITKI